MKCSAAAKVSLRQSLVNELEKTSALFKSEGVSLSFNMFNSSSVSQVEFLHFEPTLTCEGIRLFAVLGCSFICVSAISSYFDYLLTI